MIHINQSKLSIRHKSKDLTRKVAKLPHVRSEDIRSLHIVKQPVDARGGEGLPFIYTVDAGIGQEGNLVRKMKSMNIALVKECPYQFPPGGEKQLAHPPMVMGNGPAGPLCGLILAEAGYRLILPEHGMDVDVRVRKIAEFWEHGVLDMNCNVQLGEGGAGTFSDGKLNTPVKDPMKRNRKVLEILVEHGAGPVILYFQRPHIGIDVLSQAMKNIWEHIIALGGQVRFGSQMMGVLIDGRTTTGVIINRTKRLGTDALIPTIGHSTRDTFEMLLEHRVLIQQKPSAIDLRIQHPQKMTTQSQYRIGDTDILDPASYKLTKQTSPGRGVHPLRMCSGGHVVDASSESDRLAVNGVSDHNRGGENVNSALIAIVTPKGFGSDSPLAGVAYQRKLEELTYRHGEGHIPIQLHGDFKMGKPSVGFGVVNPESEGRYQFANLKGMLPTYMSEVLLEGIGSFDHIICGFGRSDSIPVGIKSRTSSPVRINRESDFESEMKGLFPYGEGVGYIGGITSAVANGTKVAEEITGRYYP